MQDPIEIKVDDKEIQQVLKNLISKTENLRPLMKNIAGIMMDSIEENFEQEGRSEKWEKLSPVTIKKRSKKGYWPGRILQTQGDLAASITSKYDENSAIVGTNKVYASIHQFGGDAGRNKKVKIPTRPYLKLTDEDLNQILEATKDYLS
ncbi:MAG: prophage MuMc02, virion morphogenesis protein [Candidatus Peregrinibacteria bacterium GW2011_GWC2_33_13]|nr:MAG: prophage MuMc02, virion morphogenesis protein [Candidatus Peregrinibacteria bacterium GW2011_GWC2_33_13]